MQTELPVNRDLFGAIEMQELLHGSWSRRVIELECVGGSIELLRKALFPIRIRGLKRHIRQVVEFRNAFTDFLLRPR